MIMISTFDILAAPEKIDVVDNISTTIPDDNAILSAIKALDARIFELEKRITECSEPEPAPEPEPEPEPEPDSEPEPEREDK